MVNIYCTRKLEKLVGKKNMSLEPGSVELGNWNANIFPVQGRKCLIMMNDISYYSILFLDILKKDLLNLQHLFTKRLIEQLDYDGIALSASCRDKLMNLSDFRFLSTNNNRKVLGTMNEFAFDTEYHINDSYFGQLDLVDLAELNSRLTDNLVGALKPKANDFGRPIKEMSKLMENFCS